MPETNIASGTSNTLSVQPVYVRVVLRKSTTSRSATPRKKRHSRKKTQKAATTPSTNSNQFKLIKVPSTTATGCRLHVLVPSEAWSTVGLLPKNYVNVGYLILPLHKPFASREHQHQQSTSYNQTVGCFFQCCCCNDGKEPPQPRVVVWYVFCMDK